MFSSNMQRFVNYIMAIIIIIGNLVILNYFRKLDRIEECKIGAQELEFIEKYLYSLVFLNIAVFAMQMMQIA